MTTKHQLNPTGPTQVRARAVNALDHLVGRNIRLYRLRRDLTQAQLAVRLGITYQQLQKYERGANRISATRLMRIAQVLEIPIAAFFNSN